MLYALNLFNLVAGKEDQYREYSVKAGKIIYGLGGRVIAAGHSPLRYMHGDVERHQLIVVEFPSEAKFQQFLDEAERQQIHELREGATTDYIWTLFNPWDMRSWVKQGAQSDAKAGAALTDADKPVLVLLPGLLCDAALWAPQTEDLSDVSKPWVAELTRDDSIAAMARRVLSEVPAQRFALAGLSMGGYVAMEIMRQAPERVQRLALLDTRASLDTLEEAARRRELIRIAQTERGFTPITNRLMPMLVHPNRIRETLLVDVIRGMAERTGVDGFVRQQTAIMGRVDSRSTLARVQCPTMVLCGRQDVLTTLQMHEEMARLIPNAKLRVIEDCGHLATLERPAEVNEAMRGWLGA